MSGLTSSCPYPTLVALVSSPLARLRSAFQREGAVPESRGCHLIDWTVVATCPQPHYFGFHICK